MGVIVGGPKAWKVFQHGQIVVAFHWINKEPAMVLFPLRKRLGGAAFVIQINMAHAYVNANGYPTPGAIARCLNAAQQMGMDAGKDTINNILTAVLDFLPELIAMPPEPVDKALEKAVGEVTLFQNGQKVIEAGIPASSLAH